jgi:hypothetical protein
LKLFGLGLVLLALTTACSSGVRVITGGGDVQSPVIAIPTQILGLKTAQEDVSKKLTDIRRPYLDAVAVFSLREDELLRATLQLSRFNRLARPGSDRFRASVIGLLGSSRPLALRVGDTTVYSTSGNKQNVFVWFAGRGFYVLSVHQDYNFPRTLLRKVIDQKFGL